jgi:hypothetical protein
MRVSEFLSDELERRVEDAVGDEYAVFDWESMSVKYSGPEYLVAKGFVLRDEIFAVIEDDSEDKKHNALLLADNLERLAKEIKDYYA